MKTDDALSLVWRGPRYYQGRYDRNCPVQSTIVECFQEILPPRCTHPTEDVGMKVRRLARLREWREGSVVRSRRLPFALRDLRAHAHHPSADSPPVTVAPARVVATLAGSNELHGSHDSQAKPTKDLALADNAMVPS
eukprot:TRINITY_DN25697_c0_g1_i1.p1 TRINITY_DN25697_c0_g1~~TRINITY_DN25697_c0_g1_i1.p1  ORF type:complete len:137 (+),score=5.17 TRINITY_DN25697_c0_g1_i1:101-511(+)